MSQRKFGWKTFVEMGEEILNLAIFKPTVRKSSQLVGQCTSELSKSEIARMMRDNRGLNPDCGIHRGGW